jgi:hypothetical protein
LVCTVDLPFTLEISGDEMLLKFIYPSAYPLIQEIVYI